MTIGINHDHAAQFAPAQNFKLQHESCRNVTEQPEQRELRFPIERPPTPATHDSALSPAN
jgi:hypothetical protein